MKWTRLIRFVGVDGKTYSGDVLVSKSAQDPRTGRHARIIHGDPFGNYSFGPVVEVGKLLQPIPYSKIRTVRCLGLNYANHAKEAGMALPEYPIVFHKPATAIAGPHSPITVPAMYQIPSLDYEVELVVLIGKECYNVTPDSALKYVAGYTVGNDVSHREWQMSRGSQWTNGKSHDGFAPIGPAIVRSIKPDNLAIKSQVNGKLMQNSNTSDMVFGVAEAISFLSKTATLVPGDLIFMGTPEGVGMGFKPPVWLKNGDVVTCEIEGIGSISNKVKFTKGTPTKDVKYPMNKSRLSKM